MKFKLKVDGKVKYSNSEQKAFNSLIAKPRSSTDIMKLFYGKITTPYNGRKIVIGVLASLHRKMTANREPFKLMRTERSGPHPMEFWLEGK